MGTFWAKICVENCPLLVQNLVCGRIWSEVQGLAIPPTIYRASSPDSQKLRLLQKLSGKLGVLEARGAGGECWGKCCGDCQGDCPCSRSKKKNGTLRGRLRSSSPSTPPAPRVSPTVSAAVSVFGNPGLGAL